MSKKVGGVWLISFALMAPCVFCVGGPLAFFATTIYRQQREFQRAYPGSDSSISIGGLTVNGSASAGYIFAGAAVLMFIIGLAVLFRTLNSKVESETNEQSS